MIKVENLYTETVITESPYFYDENGRLRIRVLEEQQQFVQSDDLRLDPETGKKRPSISAPVKDEGPIMRTAVPRAKEPRATIPNQSADDAKKAMGPMRGERRVSNDVPRPPGLIKKATVPSPIARDEKAVPPTSGNDKTDSGIEKSKLVRGRSRKPFREFRNASGNRPGMRNMSLSERLDLKKASMGDVIKDFRASDAPQFKGKSEEKRDQMAIAAKLQADRGNK